MCKVQMLRALVKQRLTAAAEEIFGLFERTIAEYEEQLCRSKEENERQRKLLDAVYNPQLRLHRAEVQQQLLVVKEEVPPEQQEWSSSVDQEDPEPPHIKEEEEELWSSQEGEQLQGLEEADITKFTFTPVPVKSEDDEEKPQFEGHHCGGPGPDRNSHTEPDLKPDTEDEKPDDSLVAEVGPVSGNSSEAETDDSDDWTDTREPQSGSNSLKNDNVSVCDSRHSAVEKLLICSVCGKTFKRKRDLEDHMRTHTGEKPFSCSECGKRFGFKSQIKEHMRTHTGEKPFSCSDCGKSFGCKANLKRHVITHTGEKNFSCSVCQKSFTESGSLQKHLRIHTGEKPFSCSVCGKSFIQNEVLKTHMRTHTGEKPFSCSVCGKCFMHKASLTSHMGHHAGGKRFSCGVCNRRFTWLYQLRNHQFFSCQTSQESKEVEPPARKSDPDLQLDDKTGDSLVAEIEVSIDDWKETGEPSGLNSLKSDEVCNTCSECG